MTVMPASGGDVDCEASHRVLDKVLVEVCQRGDGGCGVASASIRWEESTATGGSMRLMAGISMASLIPAPESLSRR
ncbi:hypothetical protein ACTWQA_47225 [Nonomuraea sp. 10N515B]